MMAHEVAMRASVLLSPERRTALAFLPPWTMTVSNAAMISSWYGDSPLSHDDAK